MSIMKKSIMTNTLFYFLYYKIKMT